MTSKEFNEKYKKYLEEGGWNGLSFEIPILIDWFDELFSSSLIHIPNFKYKQIKIKFNLIRFYSNLPLEEGLNIEEKANKILHENKT